MWIEKGSRNSTYHARREPSVSKSLPRHPLNYHMTVGRIANDLNNSQGKTRIDQLNLTPVHNGEWHQASIIEASNKALDKVLDQMNQAEDLLVAWKERQKAIDLVASNVGRLVRIARAIRRRDPKIVRSVLRRNPKAKDVIKTPSGLWLEYHFGIVPTVLDIHHACGILGYEFPVQKIDGTASAKFQSIGKPYDTSLGYDPKYNSQDLHGKTRVKIGGRITALNPDVHLATMLGFGQPLSVAWEMTPFSWFIDYFANVGQLIKNIEPQFPGVTVSDKYCTVTQECTCTFRNALFFDSQWVGPSHPYYNRWIFRNPSFDAVGYGIKRTPGWPSYRLQFKSPLALSGQRCSYIVAVLGTLLTSMKKK